MRVIIIKVTVEKVVGVNSFIKASTENIRLIVS